MAHHPIVRDFAFIKSSVPFPSAIKNQVTPPKDHHRQRTGSNSSTSSSSSGFGPYQIRSPTTSMSERPQKQLSPVVEESEDDISRMRWPSGPRVGSRTGRRPRPTSSYVGQSGLFAEDITIAMMSIIPPPIRHQRKATIRQRAMNRTKSRFRNLRQSIRLRLPTMQSMRVWKRS